MCMQKLGADPLYDFWYSVQGSFQSISTDSTTVAGLQRQLIKFLNIENIALLNMASIDNICLFIKCCHQRQLRVDLLCIAENQKDAYTNIYELHFRLHILSAEAAHSQYFVSCR